MESPDPSHPHQINAFHFLPSWKAQHCLSGGGKSRPVTVTSPAGITWQVFQEVTTANAPISPLCVQHAGHLGSTIFHKFGEYQEIVDGAKRYPVMTPSGSLHFSFTLTQVSSQNNQSRSQSALGSIAHRRPQLGGT